MNGQTSTELRRVDVTGGAGPEETAPLLSIVVPAYNEAGRLAPTLRSMTDYLSQQPYTWEIIVSDDASTDDTVEIASAFQERRPQVRILRATRNRGKGAAVRRGVLAALGQYVVFADADGATPIEEIERLLTQLRGEYEVAIGSRQMPDSDVVRPQPMLRRLMGSVFRSLVHHAAIGSIRDTQCGFKGFRAPAARHIFAQLQTESFAFDVEVLLLAEALGYRTIEVGVTWADQAAGTISPLRDAARMARDIYGLRNGVQRRLDDQLHAMPGEADRCIGIITLRLEGGNGALPVDDLIDDVRRADNTVVLERSPGAAVLGTFALTARETRMATAEMAREATEILASSGTGTTVTGEMQLLPLAAPVTWLRPQETTLPAAMQTGLLTRLRLEEEAREADLRELDREQEAWGRRRNTVRAVIVLDVFSLAWWLAWLYDYRHAATWWLYTALVLAESFSITQVLGYWYTAWHERRPERKRARVPGRVDIFITTYNESVDLVEGTVRAAVAIPYPHRTYVLDDGRRPEMGEMARRLGAKWITRPDNKGAKAGNINHALKQTDGEFFVIFDADHVPHPDFLTHMMPFMDDPGMALVQAPQYYANRNRTYVAGASMDQQEIFFGPICGGKDGLGAVFCCGTNVVFRRAAIEDVGGFRENSITEDAATTLDLHERGWRTKYVPERLAEGLGPEDLSAYISQQHRWARGSLEMLFKFRVLTRRMPLRLRLQYAWSAMFYLTGLSTVVYLSLPALFLLFGIQAVNALSGDFIAHFLPYIFLTIFILARSAEGRLRFRAIQFSYGLFPVFLSALASLALGRKVGFHVTPKERNNASFYHLVIPQLVTVGILLLSIAVGFANFSGARTITNASWALFDIVLLAGIIRGAAPQRVVDDTRVLEDVADSDPMARMTA